MRCVALLLLLCSPFQTHPELNETKTRSSKELTFSRSNSRWRISDLECSRSKCPLVKKKTGSCRPHGVVVVGGRYYADFGESPQQVEGIRSRTRPATRTAHGAGRRKEGAERRSRCIFHVVHSAAADILPAGNSTSPETPCVSALKSSAADRRSRLSVFRGGLRVGGLRSRSWRDCPTACTSMDGDACMVMMHVCIM